MKLCIKHVFTITLQQNICLNDRDILTSSNEQVTIIKLTTNGYLQQLLLFIYFYLFFQLIIVPYDIKPSSSVSLYVITQKVEPYDFFLIFSGLQHLQGIQTGTCCRK